MKIKPNREKWKSTMTDRQRFNNQMHYKPVDRCFNMEFGYWEENFKQWDIFKDNGIISNQQADIFLNFDRIDTLAGQDWMCPVFDPVVVEETETKKIIINSDGLLAEVPKDGHDTIPHFLKSSINTPDDWKKVRAERFDINHPDRIVDKNFSQLKKYTWMNIVITNHCFKNRSSLISCESNICASP